MATPFLSSEEYDERAHQLYNDGQYDEALDVLREGLMLYPNSVELHVGVGYAQLAREEYAWARRSFEQALILEPEHEDGLAGLGESLLKLGQDTAAFRCFRRTLELGYADDTDLMLQIGRALFREGSLGERPEMFESAKDFFETAVQQAPDSAEAVACVGYAQHRLGDDNAAIASLRRSLQIDTDHAEARIYLANILYDQSEFEAALYHFERTSPEDHWDELGIWRLIELKRSLYKLDENDPEIKPWSERLSELTDDLDDLDELLLEVDSTVRADEGKPSTQQYEMFGALLSSLAERSHGPSDDGHRVVAKDGTAYEGSWEEILVRICDAESLPPGQVRAQAPSHSVEEYMKRAARRAL